MRQECCLSFTSGCTLEKFPGRVLCYGFCMTSKSWSSWSTYNVYQVKDTGKWFSSQKVTARIQGTRNSHASSILIDNVKVNLTKSYYLNELVENQRLVLRIMRILYKDVIRNLHVVSSDILRRTRYGYLMTYLRVRLIWTKFLSLRFYSLSYGRRRVELVVKQKKKETQIYIARLLVERMV